MDQTAVFRLAALERRVTFALEPDAAARASMAAALGIEGIRKLRFAGSLDRSGSGDWTLRASLGATVVQACVVTLDPVTTRLDEPVVRRYLAQMPALEGASEVEMPDDTAEPMPETVDVAAVMAEALALALPAYPRAAGVGADAAVFTEPGKTPMRDEDARPFAALAAFRDTLRKD